MYGIFSRGGGVRILYIYCTFGKYTTDKMCSCGLFKRVQARHTMVCEQISLARAIISSGNNHHCGESTTDETTRPVSGGLFAKNLVINHWPLLFLHLLFLLFLFLCSLFDFDFVQLQFESKQLGQDARQRGQNHYLYKSKQVWIVRQTSDFERTF